MKKQLFCTIFFVLLISVCFGQKPYKVVFYNLENFFDTINDPEVKDDEFTPEGPKKWNTAKYNKKLGNIERVLFGMAAIDKEYPIVIGVSEVTGPDHRGRGCRGKHRSSPGFPSG